MEIMTERLTRTLPEAWQGSFTPARTRQWIDERDRDGPTLLVVSRTTKTAVGLVILHETGEEEGLGVVLRIGYMLAESVWGKGCGTELVGGLIAWAQANGVVSMLGGVERANIASRRVLEKNGFSPVPEGEGAGSDEITYQWTA